MKTLSSITDITACLLGALLCVCLIPLVWVYDGWCWCRDHMKG